MFEKSRTWQRYSGTPTKVVRCHLGYVPELDPKKDEERSTLRIALTVAALFHIAIFLVQLPDLGATPDWTGQEQPVYVVQQVRFRPPPPAQKQIPQKQRRKIPIPDPTPDDPEPLRLEDAETPDIVIADVDSLFGIPDVPPAAASGAGPMRVGGEVLPPERIFDPSPPYTELARTGRLQGIVILEAIIDAMGNVTNIKVLKGLPLGLTDSAVKATEQWKFKPATHNGVPVPVIFTLTIRFSLQ